MSDQKYPIVYATRDRERAESKEEDSMYSIYTGNDREETLELLTRASFPHKTNIVVFKNSKQIENVVREKGWNLLNPSAELAEKIENKVTQVGWLGDLADLLPPHHITLVKKISKDTRGVIQWAHSHTGEGTIHISKDADITTLQDRFPEREARVTQYVKGPVFTVNIVVSPTKILVGNISYQITGIAPFTDNPFSTIGNDWSLPQTILTETKLKEFNVMALRIAKRLQKDGWKGLFGIDVVYDEERDMLFLIEINARQPASTTYESELQKKVRGQGVPGITIFEAHLTALSNFPITDELIEINDGAQILQRVTATTKKVDTQKIEQAGFRVIRYDNTKLNSDLVRIQSPRGIMEAHNKFNDRGKLIKELLE